MPSPEVFRLLLVTIQSPVGSVRIWLSKNCVKAGSVIFLPISLESTLRWSDALTCSGSTSQCKCPCLIPRESGSRPKTDVVFCSQQIEVWNSLLQVALGSKNNEQARKRDRQNQEDLVGGL